LSGDGWPWRGWARADLGDRGAAVDGQQQCRILAEHCRLEGLEVGSGIEAELLAEALPGPGVHGQRVDLSARAIQGQHQLPTEPLVEGVCRDQLLQVPHHLAVLPEGEGGGHCGLLRDHAELHKPRDSGLGEVRRTKVAQHVAAPECEGLAQQRGCVRRVADPERLLPAVHQSREDLGIEVGTIECQPVPTGAGTQRLPGPGGGQHTPDCADVGPQRGRGAI
jgi:hypothetical protein